MDAELLIHGVPGGQDYFGIPEERAYAELFYDGNSKEDVKYVIETQKRGNTPYVYYSYLKYKGMVGAGGRSGSYFGLTLRIDQYYQDTELVFSLLNILFKSYIVGSLLNTFGDGYKYSVANFAAKAEELKNVQQVLSQFIATSFVYNKLVAIDNALIHSNSQVQYYSILDFSEEAVSSALKMCSKVVFSTGYESNLAVECRKKIQDAQVRDREAIEERDRAIAEKDRTIKSLSQDVQRLQSEMDGLRRKSGNQDLAKSVASIKDPICKLANYFRIEEERKVPEGKKSLNRLLRDTMPVVSVVTFLICLVILIKFFSFKGSDNNGDLKKQETELASDSKRVNSPIKSIRTYGEEQIESTTTNSYEAAAEQSNAVATTPLRIDVSSYSGSGPLYPDEKYVVSVKEGNRIFKGLGKWSLQNCKIESGSESAPEITIRPQSPGDLLLKYEADDAKYGCQERTLEVIGIATNAAGSRSVENGKEYTFTMVGYHGKGMWRVDGFTSPEDKSAPSIKVRVSDDGKQEAVVSYVPEGSSKKVSKNFKVKR